MGTTKISFYKRSRYGGGSSRHASGRAEQERFVVERLAAVYSSVKTVLIVKGLTISTTRFNLCSHLTHTFFFICFVIFLDTEHLSLIVLIIFLAPRRRIILYNFAKVLSTLASFTFTWKHTTCYLITGWLAGITTTFS